jgi:hypothetical protein
MLRGQRTGQFRNTTIMGMSALGTAAIALGSAGLASVLTHLLTSRRDLSNRRRELRIEYLLSAYRTIADSPERGLFRESLDARAFEKAVADIQLLGSKRQAELATGLAKEMAAEGRADPNPLLRLLRDDLRREMNLETLSDKPIHLRVSEEPPS